MLILGIETSCDETSAAVLDDGIVLANVISSQEVHLQFGGVVPELASRAHLKKIVPILEMALKKSGKKLTQIDGFAVTNGPGLVGALLVGVNFVKGLSMALDKPFLGINHIEGHIYSNFLDKNNVELPFLCLLVSGGHTQIVLVEEHLKYHLIGKTRDDAVGEAFDKVAKLLGLPYPGGPEIDKMSRKGNSDYVKFPKGLWKEKTYDFSYSGLKTAVLQFTERLSEVEKQSHLADICASFQKAAIEILVERVISAAQAHQVRQITIAGGVAANSFLRSLMKKEAERCKLKAYFPEIKYCTDNAAMIARAALERFRHGNHSTLTLNTYPSLLLGNERSYQ